MHYSAGATAVGRVRMSPSPSDIHGITPKICSGGGLEYCKEAVHS